MLYIKGRAKQEYRIFDHQHLLDATEIFRKLNVHKKVRRLKWSLYITLFSILKTFLDCADRIL